MGAACSHLIYLAVYERFGASPKGGGGEVEGFRTGSRLGPGSGLSSGWFQAGSLRPPCTWQGGIGMFGGPVRAGRGGLWGIGEFSDWVPVPKP